MMSGGGGASCSGFEKLYSATRLVYAENGRTVNYISQQQWCWYEGYTCTAGCGDCPRPTSHTVLNATEYRYDQARERYYELALDPADFKSGFIDELGSNLPIWTDFEDGEAYFRYRINPTSIANLTRYEPGLWRSDYSSSTSTWSGSYLHNDHLGTLRYTSNDSGTPQNPTAFAAFGEQISGAPPQFGYAGAWGYALSASSYLHVGHRYYDPASGRFLQRDPIGIDGGTNIYAYVSSSPAIAVDPEGLEDKKRALDHSRLFREVMRQRKGQDEDGGEGALAGAGAGGKGGKGGKEHTKNARKSTHDKHTKSHSSKKPDKAKARLIREGKWHFRILDCFFLPMPCPCCGGAMGLCGCGCGA